MTLAIQQPEVFGSKYVLDFSAHVVQWLQTVFKATFVLYFITCILGKSASFVLYSTFVLGLK